MGVCDPICAQTRDNALSGLPQGHMTWALESGPTDASPHILNVKLTLDSNSGQTQSK